MSATGIKAFDATLQTTHIWLDDLMRDRHWEGERQQAYQALRAVLHALRDSGSTIASHAAIRSGCSTSRD